MPAGERFPERARLRRGEDIRRVFRRGRRVRRGELEVFSAPCSVRPPRPRLGFVVPRHGRTVAERNRLKRRLREVARREWLPDALARGDDRDVVVRTRPGAYERSYRALRSSLLEALTWPDA